MLLRVKKILCPIDFSGASYEALDYAVGLSSSLGAELCLVHVLPRVADPEWARPLHSNPEEVSLVLSEYEWALYTSAQRKLHEVMRQRMQEDTKPRAIVRVGEAAAEIMSAADEENADLIIIASRGLTGRPDVFGSVTERVARLANRPVLIVPARGESDSLNTQKEGNND
jgi:universal stress protein A